MNSRNAGRIQEPSCEEFLDRHSDYLDGMLSSLETARLRLHAQECDACARYDRVVRRGQSLLGDLPDVEASDDFELRLQHRIFHLEDAAALARTRPGIGAASALAVAASLALLAWSPLLLRNGDAPGVASSGSSPVQQVITDPLFHGSSTWYPAPVRAPATVAHLVSFPGPYSPLIVSPPVRRGGGAAAPEYAPVD